MADTPSPQGLIVLQGNRMEDLRDLTLEWLDRRPLHPLERTLFLVQSNGIAQWLKTSIAEGRGQPGFGVCLGTEVALPARFQWQAYRHIIDAVEGPGRVPVTSPYDKSRLRWLLMTLLPEALDDARFAPLARYLRDDDDKRKRYQLAERLADLFDQYQVYRADWLNAWQAGDDVLSLAGGRTVPVPDDQRWQPALWRMIGERLDTDAAGDTPTAGHRGAVHRRFLAAAERLTERPPELPPRVVVFGLSSLPQQTLEVLVALSGVSEVVLCLLNPCQFYWGEIIETREALRQHARQQRRRGMPVGLHQTPEQLHLHAHPLLAAWGKQGRDYLQLLSEHDRTDVAAMSALLDQSVDLFLPPPTDTLLGQLQDDILNLRPLAETQTRWPALDSERDNSIGFHQCHSPQRELEVLHDQLLAAFADDPTLTPRDVMVMVPDINDYAPCIHATFGQFAPGEARHLPYHVADQQQRHREPLLVALETLLALPTLRFRASEILDLLDIAPVRARLGLAEHDLGTLQRWIGEANVRWGLDAAQRSELGLPEHDELHTWRFGLERMLMGYAVGESDADDALWADIVPYDEVAGLSAGLAGPLYRLILTLGQWRKRLRDPRPPAAWAEALAELLDDTLAPTSSGEEALLGQVQAALDAWQEDIIAADPEVTLPLAVVRESLLGRIDEPQLSQSFFMGRITFATLMPMRAIPFRHVILLGMSDGAYPRRAETLDFDLMAMRGHYRAGDRSRRDDDRYLFLEALLSARERLTISWCAKSPLDNSEQPPSVLVGQLRDHLGSGWRLADQPPHAERSAGEHEKLARALLDALTQEHPLQPFGAAYFRADSALYTYAREWQGLDGSAAADAEPSPLPAWAPEGAIGLDQLGGLLRDPVNALFAQRLATHMRDADALTDDDEPFSFSGLDRWQQRDALLQPLGQRLAHAPSLEPDALFEREVVRQQLAGHYPPEPVGPAVRQPLLERLPEALAAYRALLQHYPYPLTAAPRVDYPSDIPLPGAEEGRNATLTLRDTLGHLHAACPPAELEAVTHADTLTDAQAADASPVARIVLLTSQIYQGNTLHWGQLLRHWPAHLALQQRYPHAPSYLVSPGGTLSVPGMSADQATARLNALMQQWLDGMQRVLPTHPELALAALDAYPAADDAWPPPAMFDAPRLQEAWETKWEQIAERSPLTLREFPTLDALVHHRDFGPLSRALYADLHGWMTAAAKSTPHQDANRETAP